MPYFYYNNKVEKKGPFSGKEIKAMAKGGLITPDTVIETMDGKQYYAHGIGEVEFGIENAGSHFPIFNIPIQQDLKTTDLQLRILELENNWSSSEGASKSSGAIG